MKIFKDIFDRLGIEYSISKEQQLLDYMEEILDRNQYINLTAITEREDFIQKHYIDSLLCAESEEFRSSVSVVDVGTGGGFPGIPLAVAFPEKEFLLVDSLNKRIKIIEELCEKLCIYNVRAIHGRAEELARRKDMRQSFDLCVSRAVANMSTLSEYCLPFLKVGGTFIAYKGPDCVKEIQEASKALNLLGGSVTREEKPRLEGFSLEHKLVYIKKIKDTPAKYPRKAGMPSKEPLS